MGCINHSHLFPLWTKQRVASGWLLFIFQEINVVFYYDKHCALCQDHGRKILKCSTFWLRWAVSTTHISPIFNKTKNCFRKVVVCFPNNQYCFLWRQALCTLSLHQEPWAKNSLSYYILAVLGFINHSHLFPLWTKQRTPPGGLLFIFRIIIVVYMLTGTVYSVTLSRDMGEKFFSVLHSGCAGLYRPLTYLPI